MVAKPLCPLYKNFIKPLDRARYPELRSFLIAADCKSAEHEKVRTFFNVGLQIRRDA